jgi:thermitase
MVAGIRRAKTLLYGRLIFLILLLPLSSGLTLYVGQQASQAAMAHPPVALVADQAQDQQILGDTSTIIRGLLLELPLNGLGAWLIRTEEGEIRTVLVLNLQILEDGLLPPLSWVYVDAIVQVGGLTIATHVRLDDYVPGQVVARLADGVTPQTIANRYGLLVDSALLTSGNIYLFTSLNDAADTEALVAQMQTDAEILWAELNSIGDVLEGNPYRTWGWGGVEPSGYINQRAFTQVNLAPALARYKGDGMVIALLDTGIDLNHPALAGRWLAGYDMVADDAVPQDEGPGLGWGHGTHIAGILTHIAPNSKILPFRVLDVDGRGDIFALAHAIEQALAQGADVINLSLGTDEDTNVLREVLARAAVEGVIVVAAAGNNNSSVAQYPVAYDSVIAVTAVTSDSLRAGFANYGSWVELAAPGVGITSTIIGPQGSGYAVWSGTSMATAFVSGAATLARQKLPNADPAAIVQLLTANAQDVNPSDPVAGQLGGLLDIGESVATDDPTTATPTPTLTATPSPTPSTGTVVVTPTPTATPSATVTPTPTTQAPTATVVATRSPTPTPSPTLPPQEGEGPWRIFLPLSLDE